VDYRELQSDRRTVSRSRQMPKELSTAYSAEFPPAYRPKNEGSFGCPLFFGPCSIARTYLRGSELRGIGATPKELSTVDHRTRVARYWSNSKLPMHGEPPPAHIAGYSIQDRVASELLRSVRNSREVGGIHGRPLFHWATQTRSNLLRRKGIWRDCQVPKELSADDHRTRVARYWSNSKLPMHGEPPEDLVSLRVHANPSSPCMGSPRHCISPTERGMATCHPPSFFPGIAFLGD